MGGGRIPRFTKTSCDSCVFIFHQRARLFYCDLWMITFASSVLAIVDRDTFLRIYGNSIPCQQMRAKYLCNERILW